MMPEFIIPNQVVEAWEYEIAMLALTRIAVAFEAGGWSFEQAAHEAANEASYQRPTLGY